jgi:ADP-heptose:LPS heptosyltransferase
VGADVAVTSVILRKLETAFPGAEIVLLAPRQAREVFGADGRIRVADLTYARQGTLLGRLMAWPVLVAALDRERKGLSDRELVIVDPDSRFTQLGLLPVVEGDIGYCFFESRTWSVPGVSTLGGLTSRWADEIFGGTDQARPMVRLDPGDLALGTRLGAALRKGGASRIAAVNLGVGGNDRKRISEEFERRLVEAFLAEGHTLVLDKGVGDEVERVDRIVTALRSAGRTVVEATEPDLGRLPASNLRCDVLTWQGRLGIFGALIGASDVYVGYDSAFQHIAAALEVPVVDVFVNAPSPVFVERWTPFSRAAVSVVRAERTVNGPMPEVDPVLGEVLTHCQRRERRT